MSKNAENQEKILNFLEKFGTSSAEIISAGTGVFQLQVHKILKVLVENELVLLDDQVNPPIYTVIKKDEPVVRTAEKEDKKTRTMAGEPAESVIKTDGRDTSKLKFNGELYGKGRLVLAVVKKYIEDNPKTTLTKLKEVFPDELQPRYGLIQESSKAKKMGEDRDRFFLKPEDLIKVGDKKIAVCNQFGSHNLPLKHFKSLGFVIK